MDIQPLLPVVKAAFATAGVKLMTDEALKAFSGETVKIILNETKDFFKRKKPQEKAEAVEETFDLVEAKPEKYASRLQAPLTEALQDASFRKQIEQQLTALAKKRNVAEDVELGKVKSKKDVIIGGSKGKSEQPAAEEENTAKNVKADDVDTDGDFIIGGSKN